MLNNGLEIFHFSSTRIQQTERCVPKGNPRPLTLRLEVLWPILKEGADNHHVLMQLVLSTQRRATTNRCILLTEEYGDNGSLEK